MQVCSRPCVLQGFGSAVAARFFWRAALLAIVCSNSAESGRVLSASFLANGAVLSPLRPCTGHLLGLLVSYRTLAVDIHGFGLLSPMRGGRYLATWSPLLL